ncbi:MAG TPA: cellulase family glycosylhydrolase [Capsulimonadaceae bacterium]|jgi:hypothetical protein
MLFSLKRTITIMVCACSVTSGAAIAAAPDAQTTPAPPAVTANSFSAVSPPESRDYLWLSVKGSDIVTSRKSKGGEQRFIPVGIGYARDVILRAQDEEMMQYCNSHFLNTVRLPFYTNRFNGRLDRPIDIDQHISGFIDPVVQSGIKNHVYVLLDDHEYFHQTIEEDKARGTQTSAVWDEKTVNQWIDRWVKVATRYKDEPNILGYELCNEPNGIPAETVRDWYTRCLKAIRKVDTRHIIFVGTADWSHSRAMEKTWGPVAKSVDAPYNNIVFAFHDYPTDNHPWIVHKHVTAFRDKYNVPVMCTEFGASWWDHDETTCREFESGMMAVFAKENVGWMVWAVKTFGDNPRNPTPPPFNKGDDKAEYYKRVKALGPFDSCAYTDIWVPTAHIMASTFPEPASAPKK